MKVLYYAMEYVRKKYVEKVSEKNLIQLEQNII